MSIGCSGMKQPSTTTGGIDRTAARRNNSSAGSSRSSLMLRQPIALILRSPALSASLSVTAGAKAIAEPLEPIACAKSVLLRGDAISTLTDIEPADSPMMVMRDESPPKASMLCLTHAMAAAWSMNP
jgi:hypothetical protein